MDVDRIVSRVLPYFVILSAVGVVVLYVFFEPLMGAVPVMAALSALAGVGASFVIYKILSQERNLEFLPGEDILLQAPSEQSFVMMLSIGEREFPNEPVRANIYLTNLGILCEAPGTGEATVYIPLEKITDFGPHKNGIRFRYVDINFQFAEVMLFVPDRGAWVEKLAQLLRAKKY